MTFRFSKKVSIVNLIIIIVCLMESEGTFLRVPHGVVVGQMHELIDEVRLVEVRGKGTQLLVCGQVSSKRLNKMHFNH